MGKSIKPLDLISEISHLCEKEIEDTKDVQDDAVLIYCVCEPLEKILKIITEFNQQFPF